MKPRRRDDAEDDAAELPGKASDSGGFRHRRRRNSKERQKARRAEKERKRKRKKNRKEKLKEMKRKKEKSRYVRRKITCIRAIPLALQLSMHPMITTATITPYCIHDLYLSPASTIRIYLKA